MNTPESNYALVPRRMVEVLDHTFRMYRAHFLLFAGIVALVFLPMTALEQATQIEKPAYYWGIEGATTTETRDSVTFLHALLQVIVVGGAIAYCTSEITLGRRASILPALSRAIRRAFTFIPALLVIGILFWGLLLLASLLMIPLAGKFWILLPILLMIAVMYLVMNAVFFILPTIILERVGFLLGIRRAMALSKRRFWRVFWFVFGLWMIWMVITVAFGQFIAFILGSSGDNEMILLVVDRTIQIFITPILPIGLTLMYYDARIRTEGLDLTLMTVTIPNPRLSDIPSPVPRDAGVTTQDVKNIIILSLGMAAILAGLYLLLVLIFETAY